MNTRRPNPQLAPIESSRRSFIRGGGLILAGGTLVGSAATASSGRTSDPDPTRLSASGISDPPVPALPPAAARHPAVHPGGDAPLRIGLLGCGRRGTTLARSLLEARVVPETASPLESDPPSPPKSRTNPERGRDVTLTAMADVFPHRLQSAYRSLRGRFPDQVSSHVSRHVGLDAFANLVRDEIDVVIVATPCGFRPLHLETAVNGGKHALLDAPIATDAPGIRRVLLAERRAQTLGLAVSVGLPMRDDPRRRECVMRLRDGAIGEPVFARVARTESGIRPLQRDPRHTELEHQLRHTHAFPWLGGDTIVELQTQQLDLINSWVGNPPVSCHGQGGRAVQSGGGRGAIFDHHAVEYTYENGVKLFTQCRHLDGGKRFTGESAHGTDGWCDLTHGTIYDRHGKVRWRPVAAPDRANIAFAPATPAARLLDAIRRRAPLDETRLGCEATLTAVMGRMATYTGKLVRRGDALAGGQPLADTDSLRSLRDDPPIRPDESGRYEVAAPGRFC